jgi:hypothetical protein
MNQDTISVLVAARKNSKYLAKFLFGYFANTFERHINIEVLVMLNKNDTWNKDLVRYFEQNTNWNIRFFYEDYGLGRAGLHTYFNDLYKHTTGQWIVYFCEDHYIVEQNWDQGLRAVIDGTAFAEVAPGQPFSLQHQEGRLDPTKIWCIVPRFDNAGSMNHVLSRGFAEHMGGYLARHGNLDSYINDVIRHIPRQRRIAVDLPWFHDFTHDVPSPMDDSHLQSVISPAGKKLPKYDDPIMDRYIKEDTAKLQQAIERGF